MLSDIDESLKIIIIKAGIHHIQRKRIITWNAEKDAEHAVLLCQYHLPFPEWKTENPQE